MWCILCVVFPCRSWITPSYCHKQAWWTWMAPQRLKYFISGYNKSLSVGGKCWTAFLFISSFICSWFCRIQKQRNMITQQIKICRTLLWNETQLNSMLMKISAAVINQSVFKKHSVLFMEDFCHCEECFFYCLSTTVTPPVGISE